MSFISYAQNFEDVMLWRALKHVDKGFYIDVGANDPEIDSVTKAFYDLGWRGINIEPVSEWHEKLQKDRPHDINLKLAAGARKGKIILYEIPGTGLTTSNQSFAERHEEERGYRLKRTKTPVVRLTNICDQYAQSDIHFLKIDVEGDEKAVLQGLNLKKIRPWVLLIEATTPNSTKEVHEEWEELVLDANFVLAYVDGLNRFYVAKEHSDLLDAFRYPPNVFDDFVRSQQLKSELRAQQSEHCAEQAEAKAKEAEGHIQANERAEKITAQLFYKDQIIDELNHELQLVYRSKSWRITWPLRKFMQLLKWLLWLPVKLTGVLARVVRWFVHASFAWLTLRPGNRSRRTAKLGLLHLRNWVLLRPRIKAKVLSVLHRFPKLKARLKRFHYANPTQAVRSPTASVTDDVPITFNHTIPDDPLENLSPRARKIYADLQAAMARHQREGN